MNLLKKLMPKDSFYLVLFACIGLVGASAVWVSKDRVDLAQKPEAKPEIEHKVTEREIKLDLDEKEINKKPKREVDPKPEEVEEKEVEEKPKENLKEINDPKVEEPKIEEVEKKPEKDIKPEPDTKQDEEVVESETVASSNVAVENQKLRKPVEGEIIKDFAKDKLVYSKTLDQWSVHLGIDIAAKEGTDVLAPLDGTVKQVINDEKLGVTIVIDHGNELETIYKNVTTAKLVNAGINVKAGDVISKVSKGIGFEKLDPPHLHFEVMKSGLSVDPKSYF